MGIQLAKPVRVESYAARSIVSDTRIPAAQVTRPNTIHPAGASLGAGRIAHCTALKMAFHPDRNSGILPLSDTGTRPCKCMTQDVRPGFDGGVIRCTKQDPNAQADARFSATDSAGPRHSQMRPDSDLKCENCSLQGLVSAIATSPEYRPCPAGDPWRQAPCQ